MARRQNVSGSANRRMDVGRKALMGLIAASGAIVAVGAAQAQNVPPTPTVPSVPAVAPPIVSTPVAVSEDGRPVPPKITQGPCGPEGGCATNVKKAVFAISGSEPGLWFACKINDKEPEGEPTLCRDGGTIRLARKFWPYLFDTRTHAVDFLAPTTQSTKLPGKTGAALHALLDALAEAAKTPDATAVPKVQAAVTQQADVKGPILSAVEPDRIAVMGKSIGLPKQIPLQSKAVVDVTLPEGIYTLSVTADRTPTTYGLDEVVDTGPVTLGDGQIVNVGELEPNTSEPTTYKWIVDTTRPDPPSLGGKPDRTTYDTSATFTFTSNDRKRPSGEAVGTFQCKLDNRVTACTSPHGIQGLAPGSHTFTVQETDAATNASGETSYTWTVQQKPAEEPPPVVTPSSKAPDTRVAKVTGKVVVTAADGTRTTLAPDQRIPTGSTVNATRGRVVLQAPRGGGRVQQIEVSGGPFKYDLKTDGATKLVTLTLPSTGNAKVNMIGRGCHCEVVTRDARIRADGEVQWVTTQSGKSTSVRLLSGRVKVTDRRNCAARRLASPGKSLSVTRRKLAVRC